MTRAGCALLLLGTLLGASPVEAGPRRYALVIGNNRGDATDEVLRYAVSDAQRMVRVLLDVGGFSAEDVQLLADAEPEAVRRALIFLNSRMRDESDGALLLIFYSGHGDGSALHLEGQHLDLAEMKALLKSSPASARVMVVDACRSGGLTAVKGGKQVSPFKVEVQNELAAEGTAFLTSSAAGEDSQESEKLQASVFTHYFASALLGAADANGDGQVTLSEAFAYASERTTSSTVSSLAGPQHPSYRFDLGGRGDLVLTRPLRARRTLGALAFVEPGSYYVRRGGAEGPLVGELFIEKGMRYLALPAGPYAVTQRNRRYLLQTELRVDEGVTSAVRTQGMERLEYAHAVRKGGTATETAVSLFAQAGVQSTVLALGTATEGSLGVRVDLHPLSLEVQAVYGVRGMENRAIEIRSQSLALTLAAVRAFDLGPVTLALGLAAGGVYFHQGFTGPLRNPARDALGLELGPLLELEIPMGSRFYVRGELGVPTVLAPAEGKPGLTAAVALEGRGGVGVYF